MGNEVSRGLSPGGGLPPSPLTPVGAVRRTKSFSTDATMSASSAGSATQVDRTIQRMDKTIRKRVRGGITYNMKIVLRGDRGTGKTSLFQRLKGAPIPSTHEPTPQLQSATINWSFRANSEESVKCDVWDVVDKGFVPETEGGSGAAEANPFGAPLTASGQANGNHVVAIADATTVDVYHETHGVVFLLDVTKPHTLEYVRQQLDQVPVHIPTLVLGNFRDCGAQRKIFKEDIQELLYGGGTTQHQPVRRPQELLYFECSLLNCYGLKSLHQYFGIPFLQLKQNTIRQQLRIIEGEFTHLKHDLQAKIASQKYSDYVEHIKSTGSDIRTGRRGSGATAPVPAVATPPPAEGATNGDQAQETDSPTSRARLDRTMSSNSDIVIQAEPTALAVESPATPTQSEPQQVDLEDLPDRTTALAQAGNRLKIDYTEEERQATKRQFAMPPLPGMLPTVSINERKEVETEANAEKRDEHQAQPTTSAADSAKKIADADLPMNLEDFQVPKPRANDLDSFYSDEESEDEGGDDDDVVISTASARLAKSAKAKYHKQQFLDSDDSDSGGESRSKQHKAPAAPPTKRRSPRRHVVTTTPSKDDHGSSAGVSGYTSAAPTPFPPLPMPRPLSAAIVSPRSPTSPPRPQTASPQHSPRRRVKEIPTSVVVEEKPSNSGDSVSVVTPPQSPQKSLSAGVDANDEVGRQEADEETLETEAPVAQHIVLTSTTSIYSSTCLDHGASETTREVLYDVEDSSTAEVSSTVENVPTAETSSVVEDISTAHVSSTVEGFPTAEDSSIVEVMSPVELSSALDRAGKEELVEAVQEVDNAAQSAASQVHRPDIMGDSESEGEAPGPAMTSATAASVTEASVDMVSTPVVTEIEQKPVMRATVDLVSIPSPLLAPVVTNGSEEGMGDILEAFLNDSSSESEEVSIPVATTFKTVAKNVAESDDEDDADDDRFAAYDRKRQSQKRSKSSRRQQFSETVMNDDTTTTVSLSSSQTSSFSTTSESTTRVASSIANQDVLAAIRQAEQDALRMLEVSTPVPSASDDTVKKKKSSSHSSSRKPVSKDDAMEGADDAAGSRKKPKKKEKKSGTSSRSKRREMILTDEDE